MVSPQLALLYGVSFPIWIGFITCIICFIINIILVIIDAKSDAEYNESVLETNNTPKELGSLYWLLTSVILSFYDAYGKRGNILFISCLFTLISFSLFYICQPTLPFIIMGLSYSTFASTIWPCVSIVTKKDLLGYAFGLITSLQNLISVLLPILVAMIYIQSNSYYMVCNFNIVTLIIH
jgi:hypothetical protein